MIQRIQTIYLIAVVVLCMLMLILPYGEITVHSDTFIFNAIGIQHKFIDSYYLAKYTVPIIIMVIGSALIALITVLKYKNRLIQIKLCKLNLLILSGILFAFFYYPEKGSSIIGSLTDSAIVSYKAGIIFPMVSIILTFLAIKAIKKDEELVRSADRIR